MNLDIFKIFTHIDDNIISNNDDNDETLPIDFSNHPLYWINGFNKIISNEKYFEELIKNAIKNTKLNNDKDNILLLKNKYMFDKAWNYIKNIDTNNVFHIDCISKKSTFYLLHNINISIDYFEKLEHYEKCSLLQNIKIKVEEFLGKNKT